jgi:AcrR family transcriptional regulator
MPSPRTRPGGRSARVRETVLSATLEALADRGFANLSIDDVARRAGVHKTTVYRRWKTREALVLDALLERSADQVVVPDTGTLAGDLEALLTAVAANITSRVGRAILLTLSAEGARSTELDRLRREFWRTRFELTAVIVDRAVERGELAPATDSKRVIELAIAPLYLRALVTGDPIDAAFVRTIVGAATRTS